MNYPTIWDAALDEVANRNADGRNQVTEKYLLVLGGKSSGKTTTIIKFLNKDEVARPTVALEYTYARKTPQLQNKKTAHIWELGGGTFLAKLLEIPLSIESLLQMTIFLVLDLSDPSKLWYTAETLLNAARMRLNMIIKQESRNKPDLQQKIEKDAWNRLGGKDHPDCHKMEPFPVPLFIIGSKYDQFLELDSEHRKIIQKTIRFIAHINGASLLFWSSKNDTTIRAAKHVMNHAAFDEKLKETTVLDNLKPIYILAGNDTLEGIGNPPVASSEIGRLSTRNPMDMWRMAYCRHFPQQGDDKKSLTTADNPAKDSQFAEPPVDEARSQKDRELDAYRRQEKNKWTKI